MKANESVTNYASSLRMYTNYTVREIKKICKNIGPRLAGSQQEHEAHKYIAEEMKTCCDKVDIEEFQLAPEAFMSWVRIDGILVLFSILFAWINKFVDIGFNFAWISVAFTGLALIFVFCEFLMYWEFYDFLFPKATSHNTIGVRKAGGETKQRIIFSGHVDSSHQWTYTRLGGSPLLFAVGGYGVVSMLYVFVSSILISANVFAPEVADVLRYIQLACIPGAIAVMFFVNFNITVEGANDNLTGTMASVAIMKYLEDNNIRFENTEVVAMGAGSEESGLRGSRAYVKRHMDELKEIPTVFIGLETFRDYDSIAIYERDMTGTVKMDSRVCSLMKKAGEEAGLDVPYSSVYVGASDAAAVQKLGVPAVTLAAMDPGPPRYYHTIGDTADNMDLKTVEKCLDIALRTLFIYDEQGLQDSYK
ncbi:MAG: M20/M25/M40 family metallo-hydrolase [Clostridia bacterium]|nr:M20/M25/M40 family metallo-hydrolase [Clostridia bacterium]